MLRAVWAGLVPLSACFSIVFMARKAFIRNKSRRKSVTYLSIHEDSKYKDIIIAKLVGWGRGTRSAFARLPHHKLKYRV
jgi:hypothetical protein